MFIGHFGTAFAAKKIDSKPSLGTLILSAQWVDLIWPILLLLGIERVVVEPGNTVVTPLNFTYYPYTHSLAGVLMWGVILGSVYYIFKRNIKGSLVIGILVLSHWILDLLTHRPDLPLLPGLNLKVGLGLWNSLAATLVVEGAVFVAGVYLYTTATQAKNRKGVYGWWSLVGFLVIIYSANIFGTAPPGAEAIADVGLLQWIFVIWGYWIDRNREWRESAAISPDLSAAK